MTYNMRRLFILISVIVCGAILACATYWNIAALWAFVLFGPLILLGLTDMFQSRQAIRRNFPVAGHFRYLFEAIRPEINQYFVESNTDGRPFSREQRSVVYQRSKRALDTLPFGTQKDVYQVGYEWINHSMMPTHIEPDSLRVMIGQGQCQKPYSASIFNISAMSFGALSSNAIMALNGGAKDGNFAHNTGEGGISPYHQKLGGDLIWQIGTGYFGCRHEDGSFNPEMFAEKACQDQIKMIEIKISQGAKPAHGGILPASKVTREISKIRGVPMGKDVLSPPQHRAFSTPQEMLEFIAQLRELSGGKPVGIKLCIGKRREFLALCKAMAVSGQAPDYIAIDGGEGGTGAAPLEFSNHIGMPLTDAIIFAHNALVGFNLRERIKLIAAGRVTTGFGMVRSLCLGADLIYSARAMMMSIGCIQALRCNANNCPTGVATQDPKLTYGLVVEHKRKRVATYHHETVDATAHIMGAMGVQGLRDLNPWHIMRRVSEKEVRHFGDLYEYIEPGSLLKMEDIPESFSRAFSASSPHQFGYPDSHDSPSKY